MAQASASLPLVVSPPGGLQITTTSLPPAEQGKAYSFQLQASGGTPPYVWNVTGLPAGLSVYSQGMAAGLITGTPLVSGTFTVSILVTDSAP